MAGRLVLSIGILLTCIVYLPGMSGGFEFDDFVNLIYHEPVRNAKLNFDSILEAGMSGVSGPLGRPLSNISFALNFATTGMYIGAFKFTNLAIHLLTGALVAIFFAQLLRCTEYGKTLAGNRLPMLAAIAALVWLVHPLNVSPVLYVVQRMTSLAALFSVLAMVCYMRGRVQLRDGKPKAWYWIALAMPTSLLLGVLSKENAVLTVPVIFLAEICFFRFATQTAKDRKILLAMFAGIVGLPAVGALTYLFVNPDFFLAEYEWRTFTLFERLFTEARVIWYYAFLIVIPRWREFSLYHDDFPISTGFFEPISTAVSIAGLILALCVAVWGVKKYPVLTFGIGWFLIGHSLESSIIGLELVHEHRNYFPSIGLVFACAYGVTYLLRLAGSPIVRGVTVTVMIGMCAFITHLRAQDWSDPISFAYIEAQRSPNSYRTVYNLARIQHGRFKMTGKRSFYDDAILNLKRAAELDPNSKLALTSIVKLRYTNDETPEKEVVDEVMRRFKEQLYHWSETQEVHNLVLCRTNQECKIPSEFVFEVLHSALANAALPNNTRSQLLTELGVFYVNENAEFEAALSCLADASKLRPNSFTTNRVHAQILIVSGDFAAARKKIKKMLAVSHWNDKWDAAAELQALEKQLADAIAAANTPSDQAEIEEEKHI